jgi:hypothetical protein
MKEDVQDTGTMPDEGPPTTPPAETRKSRRGTFLIVVVLIAAAFGGGLLVGLLQARSAREAWQKEKTDLQASAARLSQEAETARSKALFWQLAEGIAQVRANLAEKNYGLARDAAAAATKVFDSAADLAPDTRAQLAPLGPLLTEIQSAADSLSPDAKSRAGEAADLLKGLLAAGAAASASAPTQAAQPGRGGKRSP